MTFRRTVGKILKMTDHFRMPVEMFLHRRDRVSNEKDDYYRLGTKLGGVVTIVIYVMLVAYFASLWITMYSTSQDILQK